MKYVKNNLLVAFSMFSHISAPTQFWLSKLCYCSAFAPVDCHSTFAVCHFNLMIMFLFSVHHCSNTLLRAGSQLPKPVPDCSPWSNTCVAYSCRFSFIDFISLLFVFPVIVFIPTCWFYSQLFVQVLRVPQFYSSSTPWCRWVEKVRLSQRTSGTSTRNAASISFKSWKPGRSRGTGFASMVFEWQLLMPTVASSCDACQENFRDQGAGDKVFAQEYKAHSWDHVSRASGDGVPLFVMSFLCFILFAFIFLLYWYSFAAQFIISSLRPTCVSIVVYRLHLFVFTFVYVFVVVLVH